MKSATLMTMPASAVALGRSVALGQCWWFVCVCVCVWLGYIIETPPLGFKPSNRWGRLLKISPSSHQIVRGNVK